MAHKEGHNVPYIQWKLRVDGTWETVDSDFWFKDKTVVVSVDRCFYPLVPTTITGFEDRYPRVLTKELMMYIVYPMTLML